MVVKTVENTFFILTINMGSLIQQVVIHIPYHPFKGINNHTFSMASFLKSNLNISVVLNSCMYINVIIPIRLLITL